MTMRKLALLAALVLLVSSCQKRPRPPYPTPYTPVGLTCGGVDDTDAIQQAVDISNQVNIIGQKCAIDSAKTVWIPSGRTIIATGSVFTERPGCRPRCRLFETKSGSNDITFIDGELVGDPANMTSLDWRFGMRLNDVRGFRMIGTRIRGFRFDALGIGGNAGSHYVEIERVVFEGNGRSHVSVARGSFIAFRKGVYRNVVAMPGTTLPNPGAAINIEGNSGDYVTDVVIDGIEAYGNVKGVVVIPGKGLPHSRIQITNNTLTDNNLGGQGYGIIANSIQQGLIYGNTISGSWLCMTIGGATETTRASGLDISRNVMTNCGTGGGFRLTGVKDSMVSLNDYPGAMQQPALGVSGNMIFAGNVQR